MHQADSSFALIASGFNRELADALVGRVQEVLLSEGVAAENIELTWVPGSFEIPYVALMKGLLGRFDVLLGLGVVLAGETQHHNVVAESTAQALQQVMLQTGCPVINGILLAENIALARERCTGAIDRGGQFAHAALEMASQRRNCQLALEQSREPKGCCGGGSCGS